MTHPPTGARRLLRLALPGLLLCAPACLSHDVKIEPIEVKPIHLTMDVNLKIQRELDDFFDFENKPGSRPAKDEPAKENGR